MALLTWAVHSVHWVVDFVRVWPVVDALFVAYFVNRNRKVWATWTPDPERVKEAAQREERDSAATAIKDAITGSMTGTGIILAAVAAIIGLGAGLPLASIDNLRVAAAASVVSLGLGAYTLSVIPSMVNRLNLAYQRDINVKLTAQLWLLVVAAARLVLAMLLKL